jgi:hypothetical protein
VLQGSGRSGPRVSAWLAGSAEIERLPPPARQSRARHTASLATGSALRLQLKAAAAACSPLALRAGPRLALALASAAVAAACAPTRPIERITIADARVHAAHLTDSGTPGDSPGDVVTFDQPLLDAQHRPIGNNSGVCFRTRVAHSYQCQWTLSFDDGSIQVAGSEADSGASNISIVGGTGRYSGIYGEMESVNNGDGTFTQTLRYRLRP